MIDPRPWPAFLVCVFMVLALSVGAPHTALAQDRAGALGSQRDLEAFFDGAMEALLIAHDVPGATLAVVSGNEAVLQKGYGWADARRTTRVDAQRTLFRAASVSKLFTWTALMQLVENGQVDLDADVNAYLKQFRVPDAFGAPVTVSNLLTHTGGFEDRVLGLFKATQATDLQPLDLFLEDQMPARIRPPGQVAAYSNWGAALAGLIIANVTGGDFNDTIEQRLFDPLGMVQSTFREPLPKRLSLYLSEGLSREAGLLVARDFEFLGNLAPAGSLSTTAADMSHFMIAHLNGGAFRDRRILRPETVRRMHSQLFFHDPRLPGMAHGFYEQRINNRRLIVHGGDTLQFHSAVILLPEQDVGLFVAFNAPLGALARDHLIDAFMDHYFPAPPLEPVEPPADFSTRAVDYAGAYRVNRRPYTRADKALSLFGDVMIVPFTDGRLLLTALGAGTRARQFVEVEPDLFRQVDGEEQIAFGRNTAGRIDRLFIGNAPLVAFDKLPWWETGVVHQIVLGFGYLIIFGTLIGSIWGLPKWFAMGIGEKLSRLAVFGACALYGAFLIGGLIILIQSGSLLLRDVPEDLVPVMNLPVGAAGLTGLAVLLLIPVWFGGFWSFFGRLRHTVVVLTLTAVGLSLTYWNLMGAWFL
ncbi:MAG: serine hydrolase domain-containing protein [Alphaproteobacteria bacterium]